METKTMTMTAVRTSLKELVAENLMTSLSAAGLAPAQIEDFEYAIPFETEFGVQYIRVTLTAADTKGTKLREGFTVDGAIAKWNARLEQAALNREALAQKRAEAKAEKEAAKANKA